MHIKEQIKMKTKNEKKKEPNNGKHKEAARKTTRLK